MIKVITMNWNQIFIDLVETVNWDKENVEMKVKANFCLSQKKRQFNEFWLHCNYNINMVKDDNWCIYNYL